MPGGGLWATPARAAVGLVGLTMAGVCGVVTTLGSGRLAAALVSSALAIAAEEACDGLGAVG
jgi:hypothetical protein